jgi:bifunctional non-homologous end joining protein LigD
MALEIYRKKRKFDVTAEPRGRKGRRGGDRYVIQKHAARRLHYDLRLELDGVMKSWAVTRGPSLDPNDKRLAVHVEDHPIDYNSFEGTIPEGEYGGGTVMIWDRGRWKPEGDPHRGYAKGHLDFVLEGEKLHGRWHLVRMRARAGDRGKDGHDNWLLIKGKDDDARSGRSADILEKEPLSVVTGRSMDEIAEGKGKKRVWHSNRDAKPASSDAKPQTQREFKAQLLAQGPPAKSKGRAGSPRAAKAAAKSPARKISGKTGGKIGGKTSGKAGGGSVVANVHLTHPDRVYWADVGVTKEDLAEYYVRVWDRMRPHVVDRPLAILRCPEGTAGECFFQKHIASNVKQSPLRHAVATKEHDVIAVEKLEDLIELVQSGALEIHTRGSRLDKLDLCDRLVFDLDPGEGVDWKQIVAAAQEVRDRLQAEKLKSFVKLSGGKGVHVVVPIVGADWDMAKAFTARIAADMAADNPSRYLAKMTKALRKGKIFIDYLRNTREATSVAPYSTRARAGAPVSMPVSWETLPRSTGGNQYTVLKVKKLLKQDAWAEIGKVKQRLPAK